MCRDIRLWGLPEILTSLCPAFLFVGPAIEQSVNTRPTHDGCFMFLQTPPLTVIAKKFHFYYHWIDHIWVAFRFREKPHNWCNFRRRKNIILNPPPLSHWAALYALDWCLWRRVLRRLASTQSPQQSVWCLPQWIKDVGARTRQVHRSFISLTYLSAASHSPQRDGTMCPIQPIELTRFQILRSGHCDWFYTCGEEKKSPDKGCFWSFIVLHCDCLYTLHELQ